MNWEGDDPDWEDDLYWDGDEENPEDTWEDFFVDWDENFTWFRHIVYRFIEKLNKRTEELYQND
ncbi:MAG: hypothetical protein ACFFCI_23850 [Promethearchaeota archaeon]